MSAQQILLVTGLSGAGKSTVLRALDDMGWEVVDNLPLLLLDRLLATPVASGDNDRPLAVGFSVRTRGFDARRVVERIRRMRADEGRTIGTLFLDCAGAELERRYDETRRRHPLASDRPAADGIARERAALEPLRGFANRLIDTTALRSHDLIREIQATFADSTPTATVLTVMSFGFARGIPRDADFVFDLRFLRNPHWVAELRPGTGLDQPVADYVMADPLYVDSMDRIEALLVPLLGRFIADRKGYVTIAFGCTGGRHRSVHVVQTMAERLRAAGFSPTVAHRDLATAPQDMLEGAPVAPGVVSE